MINCQLYSPAMTLSMAYSKSCCVTAKPLCLAAWRAASFTMLAMSAPEGGEGGRRRGMRGGGRKGGRREGEERGGGEGGEERGGGEGGEERGEETENRMMKGKRGVVERKRREEI